MIFFFKKRCLLLLILPGLVLSLAACGDGKEPAASARPERAPVELTAEIDRATANPGDIVTFTVTASYRPDVLLELPEIDDKFSEFRIVDSSFSQPARKGDRLVVERWYMLQADISGSYVIQPIQVSYRFPEGEQHVAKTPKIFIEIESLTAKQKEAKDIKDIKPPISISNPYGVILVILAILIGVIGLLLLARKLYERLRRRAEAEKFMPRPAHEEALESLERLLGKRLIEKGREREFCFEISEIFRRYMQARFGIPALDLTTDEILPRVEKNGIVEENLRLVVREFLTGTDLVKFAKYRPTQEEIEEIIDHTKLFIDKTKISSANDLEPVAAGGEIR